MCSSDLFLGVIAILFPPLAVWVKCGLCSADSIINILLCFLGYVPGLLHAWYIIAKFPDTVDYEPVPQDYENGQGHGHGAHVTYVFVPAPHAQPQQPHHQPQQQAKHSSQPNYGTTSAPSNNNNAGGSSSNGAGGSSGSGNNEHAPPTYAEAVKGDHKIQSDD